MCIERRFVRNRYTGKYVFASCGHCPACLQEKAEKRASRIRNTDCEEYETFFVNLDYDNYCVPYVLKSDLLNACDGSPIPIRRDYFPRLHKEYEYIDIPKKRGKGFKKIHDVDWLGRNKFHHVRVLHENKFNVHLGIIDKYFLNNYDENIQKFDMPFVRKNVHRDSFEYWEDHISVIWYPDIQRYIKRFRKHFKKLFPHDDFKYFICCEYGSVYKRAHAHGVFHMPRGHADLFKSMFAQHWPYALYSHTICNIFQGRAGLSRYVSSYVNCLSSLPKLFKNTCFSPCWHYSHFYGFGNDDFQFNKIQEKYSKRDFSRIISMFRNGTISTARVLYPNYVLNYYFPKFKGFSRLNYRNFDRFVRTAFKGDSSGIDLFNLTSGDNYRDINYSWLDCYKLRSLLIGKYDEVCLYISFDDWLKMYYDTWTIRACNKLRMLHEDDVSQGHELYDNLNFVQKHCDLSNEFIPKHLKKFYDPNMFGDNLRQHNKYLDLFQERYKHGEINARILGDMTPEY